MSSNCILFFKYSINLLIFFAGTSFLIIRGLAYIYFLNLNFVSYGIVFNVCLYLFNALHNSHGVRSTFLGSRLTFVFYQQKKSLFPNSLRASFFAVSALYLTRLFSRFQANHKLKFSFYSPNFSILYYIKSLY